jgi:hypothetical protein
MGWVLEAGSALCYVDADGGHVRLHADWCEQADCAALLQGRFTCLRISQFLYFL